MVILTFIYNGTIEFQKGDSVLNQIRQYRHQLELKQTIRETQISLQTELNTSIEQAQHTIDYLNSYVSIYEVGFAILGIMVALLTLITPFATYHLAVKPSQKAVEALEKDFDNKVIELLLRRKDEQINDALNKIESVDPHVSQDALSYLTHIHNDGLNEIQLFKIYKITKHTSSASVKNQLSYILSTKKCDFSTDYFSSSTWKEDLGMLQLSAQYFARFGYYNYYGPIIN